MTDKAGIRFLHNVVGAPSVDVFIGKDKIVGNLSYGELTGYLHVAAGNSKIRVKAGDSVLISKRVEISQGEKYTGIVGGELDNLKVFAYGDKSGCSKDGYSYLRFIHSVYGAPNVDVYVNNNKVFSDVKYGQESVYKGIKLEVPSEPEVLNTKNIDIYVAGTKQKVLGPTKVFLMSGGIYTLFAIGNLEENVIGGVLSYDNEDRCKISCETLQEDFDVQRYMGKWYLIGAIPQFYDAGCERQTAEYTYLATNIKVYNKCYDRSGKVLRTVTGSAIPESPCQPAALKVRFQEQPFEPPFANYLVHKTNYVDYAIVGSPTRDSFYILSRKPKMSSSQYDKFLQYARKLGYNSKLIVPSYHAIIEN